MSAVAERQLCAVVEDDPFMAELVAGMLCSGGLEVEVFALGTGLLQCAHLLQFKTLLLDLSLPDIDGFDLMDQLAAGKAGMSIVLMSGHNPDVLNAAQLYGSGLGLNMHAALGKPFTREALLATLGVSA